MKTVAIDGSALPSAYGRDGGVTRDAKGQEIRTVAVSTSSLLRDDAHRHAAHGERRAVGTKEAEAVPSARLSPPVVFSASRTRASEPTITHKWGSFEALFAALKTRGVECCTCSGQKLARSCRAGYGSGWSRKLGPNRQKLRAKHRP